MKKHPRDIDKVVEALADEPIDDDAARAEVARLKIDVKAMAGAIRDRIAAAQPQESDEAARKRRFAEAQRAYVEEIERMERRKIEGTLDRKPTREERLEVFQALLKRAPPSALVGMHFHKYESASDDELAELIEALRHLLGEDAHDDDEEG